jgi:archaellum component FlaC
VHFFTLDKKIIMDQNAQIVIHNTDELTSRIYTIRNVQVMLDSDLAVIYGYELKKLNQQVKRNLNRFPDDFMFQLTRDELESVKSQFVTSRKKVFFEGQEGGVRKLPYVFTEQGIYMLATVLRGELAEQQSIFIMRAFREMKHFIQNNAKIFVEIDGIKKHLLESDIRQNETDKKITEIFTLMDKYNVKETQGIFFQGQIFDAYAKFESFIAQAKKDITLIDNYVDLSILERFAKKNNGVSVTIYTAPNTPLTAQDIRQFNAQYPPLQMKTTTKMHDRFLIIDNSTLYHIGASLKDLGKKCFAFEILDSSLIPLILQNV